MLSLDQPSMSVASTAISVPFVGTLVWASVIDMREQRLPDWLTLPLLIAGSSCT